MGKLPGMWGTLGLKQRDAEEGKGNENGKDRKRCRREKVDKLWCSWWKTMDDESMAKSIDGNFLDSYKEEDESIGHDGEEEGCLLLPSSEFPHATSTPDDLLRDGLEVGHSFSCFRSCT